MVETRTMLIETRDIVQKAESLGTLKTFVKALKISGTATLLRRRGAAFTVLAPDDNAFFKLPAVAVRDLLNDKKQLNSFLKYHIIGGHKVLSGDVRKTRVYTTLEGNTLFFNNQHGFLINDIVVIRSDIECANGVIHVIDSLLSPRY